MSYNDWSRREIPIVAEVLEGTAEIVELDTHLMLRKQKLSNTYDVDCTQAISTVRIILSKR